MVGDHNEGPHARVAVLYPWRKGRYLYRLVREETEMTADGPFTWAAGFVSHLGTGQTIYIGSLRFPGRSIRLNRAIGSFVEVYDRGDGPNPEAIPEFKLIIGNWRLNGAPFDVQEIIVTHPERVPQVAEVKRAKQFIADGECDSERPFPKGDDAVGIAVRAKPIQRKPGDYMLWMANKR